jgi:ribosomal protein S18 acetylase RimI-like enzyme
MNLTFRDETKPSDRDTVHRIVESTGFFNPEEVLVAMELVDDRLSKGAGSDYHFLFCQNETGQVLGYTCFGHVPGTQASFDLYWIVVDRLYQGSGIGRKLLERTEAAVRTMGGTRVYVETSSRVLYEPTQAFYRRSGYREDAVLGNFYAPGDSKIIYVKELS